MPRRVQGRFCSSPYGSVMMTLPLSGRSFGGKVHAVYAIDDALPYCFHLGLGISARIQGHLFMLRRANGLPPSAMGRILGVSRYREMYEYGLQTLSQDLIRGYAMALTRLPLVDGWDWIEKELFPAWDREPSYLAYKESLVALIRKRRGQKDAAETYPAFGNAI